MATNPMHQFEVYRIGPKINLGTFDLSFTNAGWIASRYIIVKSPKTEKTVRLIIKNFFRIEADFFCFIS